MFSLSDVVDVFVLGLGFSIEALFISVAFALLVSSLRKLIWIVYIVIVRRFDELDS